MATPPERSRVLALHGIPNLIGDTREFVGRLALSQARRGKSSAQVFPSGRRHFVLSDGDLEAWEAGASEGQALGLIRLVGADIRLSTVETPALAEAFGRLLSYLTEQLDAGKSAVFSDGFALPEDSRQPVASVGIRTASREHLLFSGGGRKP